MPKGTPKRDEYLRKTSNLDRRLDNDIKLGTGIQEGYKQAVREAQGVKKVLPAVGGAPYYAGAAGAKVISSNLGNWNARRRNK